MKTDETLERLSLVLLGIAIGVIFGAIIQSQSYPLTKFDVLITVILLLLAAFFLREWSYKNETN